MPKHRLLTDDEKAVAISERLSVRIPVAIELTGISRTKIYALIKNGQLPIVKVGAATLIPMEGLREFIASHQR
jgi:excisionase family DNA binding protein